MYVEKLPMDILDPFEMLIDQYRRNKERRDSIRMERERDRSQRGRDRKRNSLKDLFKKKKRERGARYEQKMDDDAFNTRDGGPVSRFL